MIPSPGGPVPTPLPHPFVGQIDDSLSGDVNIDGKPAATQGSTATNSPAHVPQVVHSSRSRPPTTRRFRWVVVQSISMASRQRATATRR